MRMFLFTQHVIIAVYADLNQAIQKMLELSTTYMSQHLSKLVDRSALDRLFERTIAFLLQTRNISPTLRADAKILTDYLQEDLS
jgi:hypothetical protein